MDCPATDDIDFLAEDETPAYQNPWDKIDISPGGSRRMTYEQSEENEELFLHNHAGPSWAYRGGTMNRRCITTVIAVLKYLETSSFNYKRTEMSVKQQTDIINYFHSRGIKKHDPIIDRNKFHKNLRGWITSLFLNFTKETDFSDSVYKNIVKNDHAQFLAKQCWRAETKTDAAKKNDPRTKSLKKFTESERLHVSAYSAELKFRAEALLPQPISSSSSIPLEAKRKRGGVDVDMRKKRKVIKKITFLECLQKHAANVTVDAVKRNVQKDKLAGPPEPKLHKFLAWLNTYKKLQDRLIYNVEFSGIVAALEDKCVWFLKNGDKTGMDLMMLRLTFLAMNTDKEKMFKKILSFLRKEEEAAVSLEL